MADSTLRLPHKLTVDERKRVNLTGAKEVLRFDDEVVELDTSMGPLVIQGQDLRLKCLSLSDGAVVVEGTIFSVSYEEPKRSRGWFR